MRILLIFTLGLIPAAAQIPLVRLVNLSHPLSSEFQVGDRYEIQIFGAARKPISVRTSRQGRTDWGPVFASTDGTGRWSTTGQFEKSDFGGWSEIWTVGSKLATPAIQFYVKAPCLPAGRGMATMSGPNVILTCDTPGGSQSFGTPSLTDPFRTPDGRVIPGRSMEETPGQYDMQILEHLISGGNIETAPILQSSRGGLGDETADIIAKLIGANALSEDETRNVLAVVRAAFEKPKSIAPDARAPSRTLLFLGHLGDLTDNDSLKRQIAETMAYVQTR